MVELRKLLLGITDKFPKGLPSWVFVSKEKGIPDIKNPFNYINNFETGPLQKDINNADFVAIKVGDVNLSALNLQDQIVENRSEDHFLITWEHILKDGKTYVNFRSGEDLQLDGFQLFLDIHDAENIVGDIPEVIHGLFEENQVHVDGKFLRIISYDKKPIKVKKGDILLSMMLSDYKNDMSEISLEKGRPSEIYSGNHQRKILLNKFKTQSHFSPPFRLMANPVYNSLVIQNVHGLEAQNVFYSVVDIHGKIVNSGTIFHADESTILLDESILPGVYILKLNHPDGEQSIKFIRIQ